MKKPIWCGNKKCKMISKASGMNEVDESRMCIGRMGKRKKHLEQFNDKMLCLKFEKGPFNLEINDNDIAWFRYLFDQADVKAKK